MRSVAPASTAHLSRALADCRPDLLRAARQLVGAVEADDLIQSTLERALLHIGTFRPETNLLAWLRRIMSNLTVDNWRRHHRFPMASLEQGREFPTPAPDPVEPWQSLDAADIRAAVEQLPERFRVVFELHHEYQLPYAEIARRLQLPPGTVGTRLLRARGHLRKLLSQKLQARSTPRGG